MARTKDFDECSVLEKAVCLFWHKGYNGTSMQELVDTLGISRSSLYDTFGDKHNLYLRALAYYQQRNTLWIDEIAEKAASAREAIRQILEFMVSALLTDAQHKGCFVTNAEVELAIHDAEVHAIIQSNDEAIEAALLRIVQKGQQAGELSTRQEAVALTRFILNTLKGIRVSAKTITDKSFYQDIVETTLHALA